MKSTPFTHICIVKTSKYTPKVTKKPTVHPNNAKFTNHFLFHTRVNCAKSTQFADPCPELCEVHVFSATFSRFCIPSSKIAKIHAIHVILILADFPRFTLLEITQATVNSAKSAQYLLICNNF